MSESDKVLSSLVWDTRSESAVSRILDSEDVAGIGRADEVQEWLCLGETPDWSNSIPRSRLLSVLKLLNGVFNTGSTRTLSRSNGSVATPPVPETVGRFRIDQQIGRGGFGAVYRAYDDMLCRDVAVKVIPRQASRTAVGDEDWLREARAAARLSHPSVVPLYEVLEDEQCLYLISEYCDGPTLAMHLQNLQSPMRPDWAAEVGLKLAQAIAHAHGRGLVHRDIKPSNVLLAPERSDGDLLPFTPRLTDFGLVLEADSNQVDAEQPPLVGTILYMAPEHLVGDSSVDCKAGDIYATGLLIYEMLAGELPYRSTTPVQMFEEICMASVPVIERSDHPISKDFEAIYLKALAKRPEDRYGSMQAMVDDLIRLREGQPVAARPLTPIQRTVRQIRKQPLLSSLLLLLFALAVGSATVFAINNKTLRRQRTDLNAALSAASKSRAKAIEIAYRSDLYQGYLAVSRRDHATAMSLIRQVESYIDDEQSERFDLRLLRALSQNGWHELEPFESNVEEIVSIPDSDHFLVGGGNEIRLYDGFHTDPIRRIDLSSGGSDECQLHALAVASDGDLIAVGSSGRKSWLDWLGYNNESVQFISLSGKGVPPSLGGFDTTIESLAFNHDTSRLAVGTRYEPIHIIDLNEIGQGNRAARLHIEANRRNRDVQFRSDNELAWVLNADQWRRQVIGSDRELSPESINLDFKTFRRFDRSDDGRYLATTTAVHNNALLYDLHRTTTEPITLSNDHGELFAIDIAPDGMSIAAGTVGGGIAVWRLDDSVDETTQSIPNADYRSIHGGTVRSIGVNQSGTIISGAEDGSLAMWTPQAEADLSTDFRVQQNSICSAMTQDATAAIIGCENGSVWRMNLTTMTPTRLRGPMNAIAGVVAISSDARVAAVGYSDGRAFLFSMHDPTSWVLLPDLVGDSGDDPTVKEICFNQDASRMLVRRGASKIQWLKLTPPTDKSMNLPGFEVSVTAVLRAPRQISTSVLIDDDKAVLFGETIYFLDADNTTDSPSHDGVKGPAIGCYDPQRQIIHVACFDDCIRQFSLDGRLLGSSRRWMPAVSVQETARQMTTIELSPDGRNLVTGSRLGDIAIWDAESLNYLGTVMPANFSGYIEGLSIGRTSDHDVMMFHQRIEPLLHEECTSHCTIIRVPRGQTLLTKS